MEINLKELSSQVTESTTTVRKMRLSKDATSMVFQLFTKNIYSNPIGTIVREITSNAFDSHVEANVDAPVLIKKIHDKQTDNYYISFIDYGTGMSPDRIYNVYSVYFESTKRADNTQIGGFGIGGKTPLAYKRSTGYGEGEYDNSFYVITVYNNIKYYYCIYEGIETPEISLLHSEPVNEHNGTEIRIPVYEKDINKFEREMVRQLYYFENVIFENFDKDSLLNKYTIIRGKTFLFRGSNTGDHENIYQHIHVCLGRVAYPIDYDVLGLYYDDYRLPVAIKLEVGEIGVVASREHLDYNEKTIKILKKKLEEVIDEIREMLSKQYESVTTLEDYFQMKQDFGVLNFPNRISFKVGYNVINIKNFNFSNFKYNNINIPDNKELFYFFFKVKNYGAKSRNRFNGEYSNIIVMKNILYCENNFNRKVIKQSYLKEHFNQYSIITKKDFCKISEYCIDDLFKTNFDGFFDNNGKPTPFTQTLLEMQEDFFNIIRKYVQNYNTLEIPSDFLKRKGKKKIILNETSKVEIFVKFIGGSYGKQVIKLGKLFKYKMPIFYGSSNEEHLLKSACSMYRALFDSDSIVRRYTSYGKFDTNHDTNIKKSIMFLLVEKHNLKYMKYCKKAYKIEEFSWRMLHRKEKDIMNHFQTYDIRTKWNAVDRLYQNRNFANIDEKWGAKINEIKNYIEKLPIDKICNINGIDKLFSHFNFDSIKKTNEQLHIEKLIDEIKMLENANENILRYIDYDYSLTNDTLIDIMKKVMIL